MRGLLIFLLASSAYALTPPSMEVVDSYIHAAMSFDEAELRGHSGNWKCEFPPGMESIGKSRGKTMDEAVQRLQAICLKRRCATIGRELKESAQELFSMPESDFRDFLEFTEKNHQESEAALAARASGDPSALEQINCSNGTPSVRMTVFDLCFTVPAACHRR